MASKWVYGRAKSCTALQGVPSQTETKKFFLIMRIKPKALVLVTSEFVVMPYNSISVFSEFDRFSFWYKCGSLGSMQCTHRRNKIFSSTAKPKIFHHYFLQKFTLRCFGNV